MIYLDNSATTEISAAAKKKMIEAMEIYGNPSSTHASGIEARRIIEEARDKVAAALGAGRVNTENLIFTACGSESNNTAILGVAYAKTLPMVVRAFRAINEWCGIPSTIIRLEGYISIVLKTIIAFGLVFQLPLIIFVLGWFGVVTSKGLRDKRRIAIVMSFVLAMFLTPPDPMSQIFMAVPLCLLYELSIWMVWLKEKGTFGK